MSFKISSESLVLLPGLASLERAFSERFSKDEKVLSFEDSFEGNGFLIEETSDGFRILYGKPHHAYRALGLILAGRGRGERISQTTTVESLGVMLDLSRNAVLKVDALERLFHSFALMGINSVQLYMEDVYSLPDEPFFGYARGGYSHDELKQIDDLAHSFGIEVIPCIQTFGHLEQLLQWPAYASYKDVDGVLLAGDNKVYSLIGKMLLMAATCFRSRRIHIGMDEVHGVGTGRYLQLNGLRNGFDILNEHLERVVELCRQKGLRPMIWSDMYFRIAAKNHDYYSPSTVIPKEVADRIPADVELVYWDYYHADTGFYSEWFKRHRQLGKEPIFAAGGWTWGRFWAHWGRAKESIAASMKAVRREGVREAIITLWHDDGSECHPASMLMSIQYFAELAYVEEPVFDELAKQFEVFSPDLSLEVSLLASELDEAPSAKGRIEPESNFSKWILWHDPILGFLNAHIPAELPDHYLKLEKRLIKAGSGCSVIEQYPALLAKVLVEKSRLHLDLRDAYHSKNIGAIEAMTAVVLPNLERDIRTLWRMHYQAWNQWYKPFGWEVIEGRYARILGRLETLRGLLLNFLEHPETKIEEFEYPILPYFDQAHPPSRLETSIDPDDNDEVFAEKIYFSYSRVTTPSRIK